MNIKLLKTVIKVAFKQLRVKKSIYSKNLDTEVFITRDLWEHLLFRKRRTEKEVIERLLTLLVIEEIVERGVIAHKRKKQGKTYYRLEKEILDFNFAVVIVKTSKRVFIFSCFLVYPNKKRPV